MKIQTATLALFISSGCVEAFCPTTGNCNVHETELFASSNSIARTRRGSPDDGAFISRENFLATCMITTGFATSSFILPCQPAEARGRATLEFSCDRYYPRLEAGGVFYANDLKRAIEKNDWAAIKAATEEPPKKTKADKSKIDGGISERAAQAGGFSKARVVAAADLWAAAFSDSSISTKTKKMKEQTAILGQVVEEMNTIAKIALGEEKSGGGIFGFGAKTPSQAELAKQVRELYVKGGNAWNQYVFLSNDDLPVQLKRLPYL